MSEKPKFFSSNPNYTGISSTEAGRDVIWPDGIPAAIAGDKYYQRLNEAERNSVIDELTGCYNRNYFEIFKRDHLKRRGSESDFNHIGLVIADLNDLKGINDSMGHRGGDQALKDTAIFLKAISREGDIVARIGGDEFAMICFNSNNHPEFEEALTARMAEKMYAAPFSVAFGCAVYDGREHRGGLEDTQHLADSIMYAHKQDFKSGRVSTT